MGVDGQQVDRGLVVVRVPHFAEIVAQARRGLVAEGGETKDHDERAAETPDDALKDAEAGEHLSGTPSTAGTEPPRTLTAPPCRKVKPGADLRGLPSRRPLRPPPEPLV